MPFMLVIISRAIRKCIRTTGSVFFPYLELTLLQTFSGTTTYSVGSPFV